MALGHHRADAGRRCIASSDYVNRQLLGAVVDMQRALEEFSNRLDEQPVVPPRIWRSATTAADEVRELARGVNQLVTQMRSEQKVVREWVDEQAQQQAEVANMLRSLADAMKRGVDQAMARGRSRAAASTASSGRPTSTCCRRCCSSSRS